MGKSLKSMTFFLSQNSQSNPSRTPNDVVKEGVLRKAKNLKKQYYVLRKETIDSPAQLECYANKAKFYSGHSPKRQYLLKHCFISQQVDPKGEFCFAIFNKSCTILIADSHETMLDWVEKLNVLKNSSTGSKEPEYRRIWPVKIENYGFGVNNISGARFVALTDRDLKIFHYENSMDNFEIALSSVENYGQADQYFFIVIRNSEKDSDVLFMKTKDPLVAENMLSLVGDAIINYGRFGSTTNNHSEFFDAEGPWNQYGLNALARPSSRNSACEGYVPMADFLDRSDSLKSKKSPCTTNRNGYVTMDGSDSPNVLQLQKSKLPHSSMSSSDTEYVSMSGGVVFESQNSDESVPSCGLTREDSSIHQPEDGYLDMTNFMSLNTSKTPFINIPTGIRRGSSYLDMSPLSSSSTSGTISDQFHYGSISSGDSVFSLPKTIGSHSMNSEHSQQLKTELTCEQNRRLKNEADIHNSTFNDSVCDSFPGSHNCSSQLK